MKTNYTAPQLTVHGNIEEITQAFGQSSAQDTWYVGGSNLQGDSQSVGGHSTGSIDAVLVPQR